LIAISFIENKKSLFKRLFNRFGNLVDRYTPEYIQHEQMPVEERFFSSIVGYSDLKRLLMKAIVSKEPVHILLTGPPATSKTVFLLEMQKELENSHYVDGTATSGKGMIDFLFDNSKTEYLLIDEVDKINKRDQTVLYNVMETGILSETKSSHTNVGSRQQKMKLRIFATANELEKLQKPFRSRFMEFYLSEYNLQEFLEITKRLLYSRYKLNQEIAAAIANVVWNDIKTKDIRDVLQIAKLARNIDDVQDVARTLIKYRPKPKTADDELFDIS
jgi:Holliday junction resolvasome RuvABC ATP-dependent DNA helicase subunit